MVTVIAPPSCRNERKTGVTRFGAPEVCPYVGRWSDDDGEQKKQCVSLVPSEKGRLRPLYDIEVDLDTALVSSVGGSGRAT
jgi:hypothetical protein